MTWIKLDDAFFTHDKALACSDAALMLYLRCLCWSSNHLKDGAVPASVVKTFGDDALVAELIAAKLFSTNKVGFRVVNYTRHQRTRDQILHGREAATERQRRSRVTRTSRRDKSVTGRDIANVTAPELETETDNPPKSPQGGDELASLSWFEPVESVDACEKVDRIRAIKEGLAS